jgi:hypothetical protein
VGARATKKKKEDAVNKIIIAMSGAGLSPDDQQSTVLGTDWLKNSAEASFAALLIAMGRAKTPASKQQHKVIENALKAMW